MKHVELFEEWTRQEWEASGRFDDIKNKSEFINKLHEELFNAVETYMPVSDHEEKMINAMTITIAKFLVDNNYVHDSDLLAKELGVL